MFPCPSGALGETLATVGSSFVVSEQLKGNKETNPKSSYPLQFLLLLLFI